MGNDMWPWENQKLYEVSMRRKNSTAHIQNHPSYLTYASSPEIAKEKIEKALAVEVWWSQEEYILYAYERRVIE